MSHLSYFQPSHIGEILQIPYQPHPSAPLTTAILTLPCPHVGTYAHYSARKSPPTPLHPLQIFPTHKTKAQLAIKLLYQHLNLHHTGTITLTNTPAHTPPGIGIGSSSSDVFAALILCLRLHGIPHRHHLPLLSKIALMADLACDPIHLPQPCLFASRSGKILHRYSRPLPDMSLLPFHFNLPIQTSAIIEIENNYPYPQHHLTQAQQLHRLAQSAITHASAHTLAHAATLSAQLHQAITPFPYFQAMLAAIRPLKALGLAISHSGSAGALIFPPESPHQTVSDAQVFLNNALPIHFLRPYRIIHHSYR